MAAGVAVAGHGQPEVKLGCGGAFVGPCQAAEGLAGAQPSAGAPPCVVGVSMADHMQPAPRPDDLEGTGKAGSVLDQATAIAAAVAVVSVGLPYSGLQPAGDSEPCEPPGDKNAYLLALLYVNGPRNFCVGTFPTPRLT